jgi:hypothetical protein
MEAFFSIVMASFYLLLDALSVNRALQSRINPSSSNFSIRRLDLLYVFARWRPSHSIKTDLPVVYYIPCDNRETAEKLANVIHRFVSDQGNIVDLPDLGSLEKYVSAHYSLTRFDLSPFPIPSNRILEEMA